MMKNEKLTARQISLQIERTAEIIEAACINYDAPAEQIFRRSDEAICIAICQQTVLSYADAAMICESIASYEMPICDAAKAVADEIRDDSTSLHEAVAAIADFDARFDELDDAEIRPTID